MSKATIDPILMAALTQIQRVEPLNVFLKLAKSENADPTSRRLDSLNLVKRVAAGDDTLPKYQYRELDDVLQVVAPRDFVSRLLKEPEVLAAAMAPSFKSALIPPIDIQEVDESAIDRPIKVRLRSTRTNSKRSRT